MTRGGAHPTELRAEGAVAGLDQPFAGANYVDPLIIVGWNMRQKEIDELRAKLAKAERLIDHLLETIATHV